MKERDFFSVSSINLAKNVLKLLMLEYKRKYNTIGLYFFDFELRQGIIEVIVSKRSLFLEYEIHFRLLSYMGRTIKQKVKITSTILSLASFTTWIRTS